MDYERIVSDHPVHKIAKELIEDHHEHPVDAKIAYAWLLEVKPDKDGRFLWGKAKKVGKLERQFHDDDFIVLVNQVVWNELPEDARRALVDHELTHCDVIEGKPRMRKHDLEEFVAIVRRYGLWKTDVEQFVNAALKREQKGLFEEPAKAGKKPKKTAAAAGEH